MPIFCAMALSPSKHVAQVHLEQHWSNQLVAVDILEHRQFDVGVEPNRLQMEFDAGRQQQAFVTGIGGIRRVAAVVVPAMSPRLASEARRFTWLVDVLYDRRVKLILSAAVAPEDLYTEGPLVHEFPRTVSRLREMQSAEFMASPRRDVDTSLT